MKLPLLVTIAILSLSSAIPPTVAAPTVDYPGCDTAYPGPPVRPSPPAGWCYWEWCVSQEEAAHLAAWYANVKTFSDWACELHEDLDATVTEIYSLWEINLALAIRCMDEGYFEACQQLVINEARLDYLEDLEVDLLLAIAKADADVAAKLAKIDADFQTAVATCLFYCD
tara:strand:+ start:781 stop:1290 length:510 start_codon:yes stop_codon:yes gene_type:complete